jgi:SH3 domain protein
MPAMIAIADTVYVTDKLRLGVHKMSDTRDKAFAFIESGDSVEVLEQNRSYARVKLTDGQEGWVRIAYLVEDEPARHRVAKVEQERDELSAQLEAVQSGATEREAQLDEMSRQLESDMVRIDAEKNELIELRLRTSELQKDLARYDSSVPGSWAFGLAVIALAVGGFAAWWWLDRRSRQRHGGFRLY